MDEEGTHAVVVVGRQERRHAKLLVSCYRIDSGIPDQLVSWLGVPDLVTRPTD